jgi:hypothetical protein
MRILRLCVGAWILAVFAPVLVWGQASATGTVTGTVADPCPHGRKGSKPFPRPSPG